MTSTSQVQQLPNVSVPSFDNRTLPSHHPIMSFTDRAVGINLMETPFRDAEIRIVEDDMVKAVKDKSKLADTDLILRIPDKSLSNSIKDAIRERARAGLNFTVYGLMQKMVQEKAELSAQQMFNNNFTLGVGCRPTADHPAIVPHPSTGDDDRGALRPVVIQGGVNQAFPASRFHIQGSSSEGFDPGTVKRMEQQRYPGDLLTHEKLQNERLSQGRYLRTTRLR